MRDVPVAQRVEMPQGFFGAPMAIDPGRSLRAGGATLRAGHRGDGGLIQDFLRALIQDG